MRERGGAEEKSKQCPFEPLTGPINPKQEMPKLKLSQSSSYWASLGGETLKRVFAAPNTAYTWPWSNKEDNYELLHSFLQSCPA